MDIKGYRRLDESEVNLINTIKEHFANGEALLARVNKHVAMQAKATMPAYREAKPGEDQFENQVCIDTADEKTAKEIESTRLAKAEPFRWLAIARTDMQTSSMAMVRAVAQPENF